MPIEDTVEIKEMRNILYVNSYLKLGWVLIGYNAADGMFVLGWQKKDVPPYHPPSKYDRLEKQEEPPPPSNDDTDDF